MKKITKIAALTAALISLLFTGCNNLAGDATVSGDFRKNINSLDITATVDHDLVNFDTSTIDLSGDSDVAKTIAARTITPAALDGTTSIVFYLFSFFYKTYFFLILYFYLFL